MSFYGTKELSIEGEKAARIDAIKNKRIYCLVAVGKCNQCCAFCTKKICKSHCERTYYWYLCGLLCDQTEKTFDKVFKPEEKEKEVVMIPSIFGVGST